MSLSGADRSTTQFVLAIGSMSSPGEAYGGALTNRVDLSRGAPIMVVAWMEYLAGQASKFELLQLSMLVKRARLGSHGTGRSSDNQTAGAGDVPTGNALAAVLGQMGAHLFLRLLGGAQLRFASRVHGVGYGCHTFIYCDVQP
jgi:hypothetical protein